MEIIFAYTRKDALKDGELAEVTEAARRHGFLEPTALTGPSFNEGLAVEDEGPESEDFWLSLRLAICLSRKRNNRVRFWHAGHDLLAVIGPDDDGRPCLTVGFPLDF